MSKDKAPLWNDVRIDLFFRNDKYARYARSIRDDYEKLLNEQPVEIQEAPSIEDAKQAINDAMHALFHREDVSSWDLRQILGEIAGNIDEYILLVMAELDEISESQEY